MTRGRGRTVALFLAAFVAAPPAHAQPGVSCEGRPATIAGTEGPDSLEGTPERDVIAGLGGDDTITGLAGTDYICGGPGDDSLDADGSGEVEELFEDVVSGEDGDDVLYSYGSYYWEGTLLGGPGDDVFVGGPVSYERAPAPVLVDLSTGDALGEGRDTLIAVDTVLGSPFDDGMRGTDRIDHLSGGDGDDRLLGGEGRDSLYGEAGEDLVAGGSGGDWHLYGGEGDDEVYGGRGDDVLHGESYGDDPDGLGDDLLSGGGGRDRAVFTVDIGKGDRAVSVNLADGSAAGHGADRLSSIESVEGSDRGDTILGDDGPNRLEGGAGGDLVLGRGGNDSLFTNRILSPRTNEKDVIRGGGGRDTVHQSDCCTGIALYGGPGRDLASFDDTHFHEGVAVDLSAGTYAFGRIDGGLVSIEGARGTGASDRLLGDDGPNFLDGDYGIDTVRGRGGDDVLRGGSSKDDEVFGGRGRDRCSDRFDRLVGCEKTPA